MARRNKRPKVVWLPPSISQRLGTAGAATEFDCGFFEQLITTLGTEVRGDQLTDVQAVVKDEAQAISPSTLSDIEGSAYRLRRVVGNVYVELLNPDEVRGGNDNTFFYVTCALMVLRTAANNSPMSVVLSDYNAAQVNAWGDPWIWRKTWQVGFQREPDATRLFGERDANNWSPGYAVADGPHIDVKTARIVSNEERLFLITTVTVGDGVPVIANPAQILVSGELRCLASMRTMAGNRRNASR